MAVPESAARRRRQRRSVLRFGSVLVALLGLALPGPIWAEGRAQDLPTAPVHLAAASEDSVGARVDLDDSTKGQFSSTGNWMGYLDFLGKPGTARNVGEPDMLLPMVQDQNDLTFLNLRGQLNFDNSGENAFNLGLAHRHMFNNWILGLYGYVDQNNIGSSDPIYQGVAGVEMMTEYFDLRANAYVPEDTVRVNNSALQSHLIDDGVRFGMEHTGTRLHKALMGFDAEFGTKIPVGLGPSHELRVFGGGYYYPKDGQFEEITGPRGRAELRSYDLPLLGPGSRFMMGVEYQYDDARGDATSGLASLRIPFDVFSDKSKRKSYHGLERRMLQPIVRTSEMTVATVDVNPQFVPYTKSAYPIDHDHEVVEEDPLEPTINEAGKAYTKKIDVYSREELAEALETETNDVILIVVHGDPDFLEEVQDGEWRDMWEQGNDEDILIRVDQTVTSADRPIRLYYEDTPYVQGGYVDYIPEGTAVGLYGTVEMSAWSQLNGMYIDGTARQNGIAINDGVGEIAFIQDGIQGNGPRWITNSLIVNAAYGVVVEDRGNTLYVRNSQFYGHSQAAMGVRGGAALYGDHLTLTNNWCGIFGHDPGTYISLTNSTISHNDLKGIEMYWSAIFHGDNLQVENNAITGLFVSQEGIIHIRNSHIMRNHHHGMHVDEGGRLLAHNVDVYENGRFGLTTSGNSYDMVSIMADISGSRFFDNGQDGINIAQGPSPWTTFVTITDTELYHNGWNGLSVMGGDVTITNSALYDNTFHGIILADRFGDGVGTVTYKDIVVRGNGGYGLVNAGGVMGGTGIEFGVGIGFQNILGDNGAFNSGELYDPQLGGCMSINGGDGSITHQFGTISPIAGTCLVP